VLWKQRQTTEAYKREKQRTLEAQQRFEMARRSADEMIRIANEELSDSPEQQRLRRRLLEAALAYYQEFIELRRTNPEAQADLEFTRARVQAVLADLEVMRGAERHMLLSEPAVQNDLKLSSVQRTRLAAIFREIIDHGPVQQRELPKVGATDRSAQLLGEMRTHEYQIAEILTAAQLSRLKQIALQTHGVEAFREPEVIDALRLTREQQELIREIDGFPPRGPGANPADRHDPRSRMSQVIELLTADQLTRWREMTGEPFTAARTGFRRGPPPPPGRTSPQRMPGRPARRSNAC